MAPPHSRCRRSGPVPRDTTSRRWSRGRIGPGSRGRPAPRPVGDAARELGLEVLTPARIGAPDVVARPARAGTGLPGRRGVWPDPAHGADRPAAAWRGQRPRIAAPALARRLADRARHPRGRRRDRRLDHAHGGRSRHRPGLLDGACAHRRRRHNPTLTATLADLGAAGAGIRCSTRWSVGRRSRRRNPRRRDLCAAAHAARTGR